MCPINTTCWDVQWAGGDVPPFYCDLTNEGYVTARAWAAIDVGDAERHSRLKSNNVKHSNMEVNVNTGLMGHELQVTQSQVHGGK